VLAALAAVVAAAIAVPLLTLGGENRLTKAEYSQRVTAIYRSTGEAFLRAAPGRSASGTSKSLRAIKAALDRAARALSALHPPRDGRDDHRLLVAATEDYAAQVDLLRASVDFGDPATIASHLREITAPGAIRRALADLARKGYRIPVSVVTLR
jgi:hypothetical protein